MIARIWHGYTTPTNAAAYESLLRKEVFISIEEKEVIGYQGIQLLKRSVNTEIEFTTIMWFENMEAVKLFAGEHYENAYLPGTAKTILSRFDETATHYDVIHELYYGL